MISDKLDSRHDFLVAVTDNSCDTRDGILDFLHMQFLDRLDILRDKSRTFGWMRSMMIDFQ